MCVTVKYSCQHAKIFLIDELKGKLERSEILFV